MVLFATDKTVAIKFGNRFFTLGTIRGAFCIFWAVRIFLTALCCLSLGLLAERLFAASGRIWWLRLQRSTAKGAIVTFSKEHRSF